MLKRTHLETNEREVAKFKIHAKNGRIKRKKKGCVKIVKQMVKMDTFAKAKSTWKEFAKNVSTFLSMLTK